MLIDTTIDFNNQIVEVKVSKFSLSCQQDETICAVSDYFGV